MIHEFHTAGQPAARPAGADHNLEVRQGCRATLTGYYPRPMRETLAAILAEAGDGEYGDRYGERPLIADFEEDVRTRLGHEAALFMPSGKLAQQVALRLWTERSGSPVIGLHPRCHLVEEEAQGMAIVSGLTPFPLCPPTRLLAPSDLDGLVQPLGALVLELPQRRMGCMLPTWDDLSAIAAWARARRVPLHFDAARLWEAQPHYARPLAEIASLADSLYVSFYKGLGGLAGAALVGPAWLVERARLLRQQYGGLMPEVYPYILAARRGLREALPQMAARRDRAVALAARLHGDPWPRIMPAPPHTNTFLVAFPGDPGEITQRAVSLAEATGLWVCDRPLDTGVDGLVAVEIVVNPTLETVMDDAIVDVMHRLIGIGDT